MTDSWLIGARAWACPRSGPNAAWTIGRHSAGSSLAAAALEDREIIWRPKQNFAYRRGQLPLESTAVLG